MNSCYVCKTPFNNLKCTSKYRSNLNDSYCCKCWAQYQEKNGYIVEFCITCSNKNSLGSTTNNPIAKVGFIFGAVCKLMFGRDPSLSISQALPTNTSWPQTNQGASTSNSAAGQPRCPICLDNELEYVLIDCGHLVCGECLSKIEDCPICRATFREAIRISIPQQ